MNVFTIVAHVLDKLPLDRLLIKPRDTSQEREELKKILLKSQPEAPTSPPPLSPTPALPKTGNTPPLPKVHLQRHAIDGPSNEETVAYQNREIGKILVVLKKHMVQGFLVAGKPCDCGQKHLELELESLCEETIPMVENPDIYYRILKWIKEVAPKTTVEAVASGEYVEAYKGMSHQARGYQKELMGTEDVKALWGEKTLALEAPAVPEVQATEVPSTEEERKELLSRGFIL